MTADFYLTLPSNASMHLHPDNTLTHYVTSLPQRISLSGECECGLVVIQYPHDWYNVREKDSWFFLSKSSSDGHSVGGIAAGYYDGTRKFTRAINRSLAGIAVRQRVKLSYSGITQKLSVRMSPSTEFTTQGYMGVILGLDTRTICSAESHMPLDGDGEVYIFMKEGDSVVDMKPGFESLYVYTNVVESRTAVEDCSDTRRTRTYDLETFRARSVLALVAQGVWNNRNRYKRRYHSNAVR